MQLYIKSSHSLTQLASYFINEMQQRNQGIFVPYHIVTQTDGMNSWLKQQIAQETGIAVNLKFLHPNELINDIFKSVGGTYEKTLSKTDISWLIYDYLGNKHMENRFPEVAAYYHVAGKEYDLKKVALSEVIADLFDQYQVYRPEMLSQWDKGILTTKFDEEKWQMAIWKYVKEKAGSKFPDKNKIRNTIIDKLNDTTAVQNLKDHIPCVYFFGTSLLTEYHLNVLIKVSEVIPVFIFLPNPSPDVYWYEDESLKTLFYKKKKGKDVPPSLSNPLLLNWGKLVQNTFMLLFRHDEIINNYEALPALPLDRVTMLTELQRSIYENSIPEKGFFTNDLLNDGTLTIQSCHSAAREVETLYNYLIELLNANKGIYSTRDIIVQVTDINKYASYIRAVFNNAPYRFNYTIADESLAASDSLSRALYEVLTIDESTFTAEAVIQLLDFDSIKKRFGVSDVDLIRRLADEANIRHGMEGSERDESLFVSWKYGISRIMYGICISGEELYGEGISSFYPLDSVESNATLEAVRFVHFVNTLIELIKERKEDRTLADWSAYFKEVMARIIFDNEQSSTEESNYLIKEINDLASAPEIFDKKVPYAVFLRSFLPRLNDNTRTYRFAREGITFCSFIPMRSIPFKIVAMLGLDFNKFPRKTQKVDFDLMSKSPKTGDRNIKTNDKHLFLETILSAGDHLYMSYNGRRMSDNVEQPPSILVEELLNYIESASNNRDQVRNILITQQPLHLFSSKYQTDPGLNDYLLTQKPKAQNVFLTKPREPLVAEKINLNDLISFFRDPITAYYEKILGINFNFQSNTLADAEIFSLNNLQQWSLKDQLIFSEQELDVFTQQLKKKGRAPLANVGTLAVLDGFKEIEKLKETFEQLSGGTESSSIPVEIKIDDIVIEGEIGQLYGNKLIHLCISKKPNKYILRSYITALVLAGLEKEESIHFLSLQSSYVSQRIDKEKATEQLQLLLQFYKQGLAEVLTFHPDFAITEEELKKLNFRKCLENLGKKQHTYYDMELQKGIFSDDNAEARYRQIAEPIIGGIAMIFKPDNNAE